MERVGMHKTRGTSSLCGLFLAVLAPLVLAPASAQTLEEKVHGFELKNGMTFLVVERHEAPVAICAVAFNVGAANEGPNITGISHLIEHMMFKGTEMMGTKDYEKEVPYLKQTDELGDTTIRLRREIGEWRFAKFRDFSRQLVSSFSEAEKSRVGSDKYEQNLLLAEKIRQLPRLPDSLAAVPYLLEDQGKKYLDLFLEHELAWGRIAKLLDDERQYIKKNELWETYMNNGARFLNAFTSNDATCYFAYLPSNRLELFMDMEADRMETPVFREFWTERDVIMEERRLGENDPDEQLGEAFNSVAFMASPYKWPVVGWMSDLQSIDRQAIEDYHRLHYSPNNAVAIIVGDVSVDQVRKFAEKYFGPVPRQPDPPLVLTREPEQKGERRLVVEHTANPKLMIGFHKPVYPDPDDAALSVLAGILGDGRTSRLYKSVFEEQELTAEEPRVYSGPGDRYDNLLVIEAAPRNPHTLEEVEKAILDEVERLKTEPVSERELQRLKNQVEASNIRQLGSNIGIAFHVGFAQIFYGDYHAMFRRNERIMKVSAEDVMRVANKYLTARNRTVAHRVQVGEKVSSGSGKEAVDRQALMKFIQGLPEEEQLSIAKKMQELQSDEERQAFGRELWERAKAARGGK
jgi:predicted Zn-dependent peptidase